MPSRYEWRRRRGRLNTALEKLEDIPANLLTPKWALVTDSAKRELFQRGIDGRAVILKAPSRHGVSQVGDNIGRFVVRVEVSGRAPYETKAWQTFERHEWQAMSVGAVVAVKVDPSNPRRVLLLAPDSGEQQVRTESSAALLATGLRATAVVTGAQPLDLTVPGITDPFFTLALEIQAPQGPPPWTVSYAQRVPAGALEYLRPGTQLQVAYARPHDSDAVVVDWPASTGGRFG